MPNGPIGTACLPKEGEDQSHGTLHFGIRIQQDAAGFLAIDIADRQRKAQFAALGLVAFASLEARADKMEFGLGNGPFESQLQLIVEIGRIVEAIGIDDQGPGQRANLQQAMSVAAQAR